MAHKQIPFRDVRSRSVLAPSRTERNRLCWEGHGASGSPTSNSQVDETAIATMRLTRTIILFALVGGFALSRSYASAAPDPIARAEYVSVGGAKLFLMTRGTDRSARVLLWLHGGPGGAERPRLRYFNDDDVLERLRTIGAPPHESAAEVLAVESLVDRYGGLYRRKPNRTWVVLSGIVRGLVAPWEIPRFIRGNNVSLPAMNEELLRLDLARSVAKVDNGWFGSRARRTTCHSKNPKPSMRRS